MQIRRIPHIEVNTVNDQIAVWMIIAVSIIVIIMLGFIIHYHRIVWYPFNTGMWLSIILFGITLTMCSALFLYSTAEHSRTSEDIIYTGTVQKITHEGVVMMMPGDKETVEMRPGNPRLMDNADEIKRGDTIKITRTIEYDDVNLVGEADIFENDNTYNDIVSIKKQR